MGGNYCCCYYYYFDYVWKCLSCTVYGGGTGKTMTQQTQEEVKTNTGNMATDRTLLELELSCPVGTSGTALTPGVIEWSLILPQRLIDADSVGGESQGNIHSGGTRAWTLRLSSAEGCLRGTANVWTFMPSLKVYLRHFGIRERGWSGRERGSGEAISAGPDTFSCTPKSDLHGSCIQEFL